MILRFFRRNDGRETIQRLYGAIVAHSRDPAFYTAYGVPDTIEGRFEMILVHAFLLFHRLKDESAGRREFAQRVFDAFCVDMDANLREMGVGDLTVPKKMKRVAEAFYGRVSVYDAALAEPDDASLADAVHRNVYADDGARLAEAQALALYMRRAVTALAAVPFETFAAGELPMPPATDINFKEVTPS
ncbi:ubiquinol-cytochrome C chaperone family protein [Ancylobacter amanitiformis]|uniref:Cytochrome b pre-mRNA-processing protein 3 n=1 Tax=Ancylobacter amanitiformis TaxID=217069 RepID=A0ABU0LQ56_9HYPH|nr:ubiquinol-cytochrome C chaperone family protein [Ancylobacter amanitiformis]MDQ0510798.1 cytochrome b pre-mRNA-processing protein 3 [Ancylobacter amanitiformis]